MAVRLANMDPSGRLVRSRCRCRPGIRGDSRHFAGFGTSRLTAGATAAATLGLGHVLLKCLLATQAVYFLQDACRNGTMEMLLMTPVTDHQLLNGRLAGLRRMILGPFLVLAGAQFALGIIGRCLAGGDWPSTVTMVMAGAVPPPFFQPWFTRSTWSR